MIIPEFYRIRSALPLNRSDRPLLSNSRVIISSLATRPPSFLTPRCDFSINRDLDPHIGCHSAAEYTLSLYVLVTISNILPLPVGVPSNQLTIGSSARQSAFLGGDPLASGSQKQRTLVTSTIRSPSDEHNRAMESSGNVGIIEAGSN
jgi:hypothetical protein